MEFQIDKIKAIAMDLDGTALGDDGKLSRRTLLVLRKCILRGLRVIITTGRSMDAAEMYRDAIGAEGPMVYYNGAVVLYMPERKILSSHFIGQDVISRCVGIAQAEGVHFHIFLCGNTGVFSETLMAEKDSHATEVYHKRTGLNFLYGDLKNALFNGDLKYCAKGIFIDDEQKLRRIQKIIHESSEIAVNTMLSTDFILEVLASGVSKAAGLQTALEFYGLRAEETIAFGDEENDISMLSFAGYSVAPSNARESARNAAKLVIGPNTDDSVADFLEKTFLQ
jgi:Cof subfamily protein (haloacid dehalogenase superfamily)